MTSHEARLVVCAEGVSKKYCRSFKRAAVHTTLDLLRNMVGLSSYDGLRTNEYWSLHDVSFELRRGECLGVLGANGSGKSTLLKILAGILEPSRGSVAIEGRVGSLIEVGAGFHPDLSGRENVLLNGTILGLSLSEVREKLDQIVEFSGVGAYIDSPVRFYSSGMYVRLGFAVAAHVHADLLLIDEVLAVGDLAFTMKCLTFLHDFRRRGGTAVFVSHNLVQLSALCDRLLHISKGIVVDSGDPPSVVERYERLVAAGDSSGGHVDGFDDPDLRIEDLTVQSPTARTVERVEPGDPIDVTVRYEADAEFSDLVFNLALHDRTGVQICAWRTDPALGTARVSCRRGHRRLTLHIHQLNVQPGLYRFSLRIWSGRHVGRIVSSREQHWPLVVAGGAPIAGVCHVPASWEAHDAA